jgi:hypothetical protein
VELSVLPRRGRREHVLVQGESWLSGEWRYWLLVGVMEGLTVVVGRPVLVLGASPELTLGESKEWMIGPESGATGSLI